MSFQRAVYHTSHFKRFSDLDIKKKKVKENAIFNFIVYFIHLKALVFSLKHAKTSYSI